MRSVRVQMTNDVGNHINIEGVAETLVPLGLGDPRSVVVGETLQSFAFNRRQFADMRRLIDECCAVGLTAFVVCRG